MGNRTEQQIRELISSAIDKSMEEEIKELKTRLHGAAETLGDVSQGCAAIQGVTWAAEQLLINPDSASMVDPYVRGCLSDFLGLISRRADALAFYTNSEATRTRGRACQGVDG